jgi:ribosomal-protein-alanine N-acetyltransferase
MIRSFEKRDLAALYQLDQVCFPPEIAYSRAELRYFVTHRDCSCWLVERWVSDHPHNKLAGFVIVERVTFGGQAAAHIVTLDVDPNERRRGFGKLLMDTVEQQMKQEGAGAIRLEVAENNLSAQQFYRSLGFASRGRIPKYYGGKIDAEVMEKTL